MNAWMRDLLWRLAVAVAFTALLFLVCGCQGVQKAPAPAAERSAETGLVRVGSIETHVREALALLHLPMAEFQEPQKEAVTVHVEAIGEQAPELKADLKALAATDAETARELAAVKDGQAAARRRSQWTWAIIAAIGVGLLVFWETPAASGLWARLAAGLIATAIGGAIAYAVIGAVLLFAERYLPWLLLAAAVAGGIWFALRFVRKLKAQTVKES